MRKSARWSGPRHRSGRAFGGATADRGSRCAEHDLRPVPGHRQEGTGEGTRREQAQIFQKKTATVTFDADKATAAGPVKTTEAGFPSAVRKKRPPLRPCWIDPDHAALRPRQVRAHAHRRLPVLLP